MVLWQGPFLKVTTLNRENATKKQTSIIFPSDNFYNPVNRTFSLPVD